MRGLLFASLPFAIVLAACKQESPQAQHATALAKATTSAPADARLASLYQQSCKTCHSIDNTGAPLVGDRSQWDARWNKGLPVLVKNVITGFNGMPAGGQCFACTAADYEVLIRFLAGRNDETK